MSCNVHLAAGKMLRSAVLEGSIYERCAPQVLRFLEEVADRSPGGSWWTCAGSASWEPRP